MAVSIIKVYNSKYNAWEERAKVCLQWNDLKHRGFSQDIYTDQQGIAVIEHNASGEATVYVNGVQSGELYTPGSCVITI